MIDHILGFTLRRDQNGYWNAEKYGYTVYIGKDLGKARRKVFEYVLRHPGAEPVTFEEKARIDALEERVRQLEERF